MFSVMGVMVPVEASGALERQRGYKGGCVQWIEPETRIDAESTCKLVHPAVREVKHSICGQRCIEDEGRAIP